MREFRERLIDLLLREELGGQSPPDLTERILARAVSPRRWRMGIALAVAAAAVLILGIGGWLLVRPGYPSPRASGGYELAEGAAVGRGAVLRTRSEPASLEMGGYCKVEMQPHTVVRLQGEERAEDIWLESGEVRCAIRRDTGTFAVKTPVGTVSVVGTEFVVRFIDEGDHAMLSKRMVVRVLVGAVLVTGTWGSVQLAATEERSFTADKKEPDKKDPETRSGTVVGVLTAKTENSVEVKADGEEKARRYVPNWVGGAPAQGGGFDKAMLKTIKEVKIGSRVRIEWKFEERPRVVKLEVLKAPVEKEK